MGTLALRRYALSAGVAAALLAGCGAFSSPIGVPANRGESTTMPMTSSQDLIYVATDTGLVYITTYPDGKKVGSINFFAYFGPDGACADASGNVWVAGGYLAEFSHGGTKPIETRESGIGPFKGCSVDPTTGDLAAANRVEPKVFVWPQSRNKPKVYRAASASLYYCGYDDRGNLFVDGIKNGAFLLLELPKGGRRLQQLTFSGKVSRPGEVQWDGNYVTIQEAAPPGYIYQVNVSGSTASVVNTIRFAEHKTAQQSWIQDGTVLVPHSTKNPYYGSALGLFAYPAGGRASETLKGGPYKYITAVTVSVAPSR
jgi:hypothetical protein